MTTTSWLGSWDGYTLKAITPANAVKAGIGTTAIGKSSLPVYWDGSKFVAITSYEGKAATAGTADSASRLNITSTDNAIARFNGTNGAIQNSTATISDNGTMTIKGKLIVNPSYDTSNSYNEGIRIN